MAKIALCWELGSNHGHIYKLLPIARELRQRGHEVVLVLREFTASVGLVREGFRLLQAPYSHVRLRQVPAVTRSYAEMLASCGYLDAGLMSGLVAAWKELFKLFDPDVVIGQHAPTALLALRGSSVRKIGLGHGFDLPPRISPFPAWRKSMDKEPTLELVEAAILKSVNQAMQTLRLQKLERLSDIFDLDDRFLCTFPELDWYRAKTNGGRKYFGAIFSSPQDAVKLGMPTGSGNAVLAYVQAASEGFVPMLEAIRQSNLRGLVISPDLNPRKARTLTTDRIVVTNRLVDLPHALSQADLVISNGGHGVVAAALLAGKPQLLNPVYVEQSLTALRCEKGRFSQSIKAPTDIEHWKRAINQLLREKAFMTEAMKVAEKYRSYDVARQVSRIVDVIDQRQPKRALH